MTHVSALRPPGWAPAAGERKGSRHSTDVSAAPAETQEEIRKEPGPAPALMAGDPVGLFPKPLGVGHRSAQLPDTVTSLHSLKLPLARCLSCEPVVPSHLSRAEAQLQQLCFRAAPVGLGSVGCVGACFLNNTRGTVKHC